MKNKIFFLTALCFISLGEINSQSEDYAKYYNKANSLSENDFEKAEKNYRVAINDSLADLKAAFNLSNEYYTEGYFEDAILRQLEAIKLAKNKIEKHKAYHNLGNSFMKKEMCSEAVSAYKSALRNNPNDDETRYNLALAKKCEDEQSQNDDDQQDDQQDEGNKEKDNDKKDDQDQQKDNQGKDDEDQQKDNKGKDDPDQQKDKNKNSSEDSKPTENKKSQLSKQQINNLLKAMENAEKKVQAKVNESKQKGIKVISEKDW
ncbi:MAG: aerotolerance regulator BatC [Flavobacteriaceae bacterium]|tara:strand:- start:8868 stop:9650 length:783 start_codon:yes stop_codon:yes gene_type:complete